MIFSVFNALKLVYGLEVEVLYIMFYVDDYKSNLEFEDEDDGELGLASDGLVPSSKDLVWVLGKCYYYDTINYSLFICTKGTFI